MKQTKTYCDICEKEILRGYGADGGSLKLTGRVAANVAEGGTLVWTDICRDCSIKLFSLLRKHKEKSQK